MEGLKAADSRTPSPSLSKARGLAEKILSLWKDNDRELPADSLTQMSEIAFDGKITGQLLFGDLKLERGLIYFATLLLDNGSPKSFSLDEETSSFFAALVSADVPFWPIFDDTDTHWVSLAFEDSYRPKNSKTWIDQTEAAAAKAEDSELKALLQTPVSVAKGGPRSYSVTGSAAPRLAVASTRRQRHTPVMGRLVKGTEGTPLGTPAAKRNLLSDANRALIAIKGLYESWENGQLIIPKDLGAIEKKKPAGYSWVVGKTADSYWAMLMYEDEKLTLVSLDETSYKFFRDFSGQADYWPFILEGEVFGCQVLFYEDDLNTSDGVIETDGTFYLSRVESNTDPLQLVGESPEPFSLPATPIRPAPASRVDEAHVRRELFKETPPPSPTRQKRTPSKDKGKTDPAPRRSFAAPAAMTALIALAGFAWWKKAVLVRATRSVWPTRTVARNPVL